jgi:hypothetical protein
MRGKPPKEILERRESPPPRKPAQQPSTVEWDWKFWAGLSLAIAGLILTALGLQARPAVSLEAPLDPKDVLTTPIEFNNGGWLDLEDVKIITFVRKIERLGNIISSNITFGFVPPTKTLMVAETTTVLLTDLIKSTEHQAITSADIALIAFYKPAYFPFWPKRKAFRFVAARQADGTLRLQPQPAEDTLDRYDQLVNKFPTSQKQIEN